MTYHSDDTILPRRPPVFSGRLDGDNVLPSQHAAGVHIPGYVIDNRYTVVREIGRGGMGVVYEVEDDITGDRYAIKRLLPEFAVRPEFVQQFRREGAVSMRFTHQSKRFVTTQTIGLCGGLPYIVMQLIQLPTLRQLLQTTQMGMQLDYALTVLGELAKAVAYIHDLGLIHRNINPENIFVDSTVSPPIVMLADFGLTPDLGTVSVMPAKGGGSNRYSSPEQRKGLPTTMASDIYGFGVITYEFLTGQLPEIGDTLSDFVEDVPNDLEQLITQSLSSRIERRPPDGAAVLEVFGIKKGVIPRHLPQSRLASFRQLESYIESLCNIPAGTFTMGSDLNESEKPLHKVALDAFRLGSTPVTVGVWKEYCNATGLPLNLDAGSECKDDNPIFRVSWYDIVGTEKQGGFCAWASDIAGFSLFLPTEAQFEYALRGGDDNLIYPWGNEFDDGFLWCSVQSNRRTTAPVDRTSNIFTNKFGLTDMVGNVWQWCSDWYDVYPCEWQKVSRTGLKSYSGYRNRTLWNPIYEEPHDWYETVKKPFILVGNPQGPLSGEYRCARGGAWNFINTDNFRCAMRGKYLPWSRGRSNGFRLAAGPA
jgi:formylglycine-generating enzyme required for sulfatase activity